MRAIAKLPNFSAASLIHIHGYSNQQIQSEVGKLIQEGYLRGTQFQTLVSGGDDWRDLVITGRGQDLLNELENPKTKNFLSENRDKIILILISAVVGALVSKFFSFW